MKIYAEEVKRKLEDVIANLEKDYKLYVKNPGKDFSKNRKLNFKEMIRILLSVNGKSLNHELMEYFSYDMIYLQNRLLFNKGIKFCQNYSKRFLNLLQNLQ